MNVHKKWTKFVLTASINELRPPSEFHNSLISKKKVVTHRIVNLMNLTDFRQI